MKRFIVILVTLFLCIVATIGGLYFALQSARVQTAAVAIVTKEFSRAFGVDAHIDEVHLRPPLRLQLKGVYLSDQQGDTLVAVPQIRVRMALHALEKQCLRFPLIQLDEPVIRFVQDSATTNIDFLLHAFQSPDTVKSFPFTIDCKEIALNKARIHYIHIPSGTDLTISDFSTNLGFSYEGRDRMAADLRNMHIEASMAGLNASFEADLHGTLDTIYADQLRFVYRGTQILQGRIELRQPLKPDELYTIVTCDDLYATSVLVNELVGELTKQPFEAPQILNDLGAIHYRGTIAGRLDDLQLQGSLRTYRGTLTTKATVRDKRFVKATVSTRNMDLGVLLKNPNLGKLSASCSASLELGTEQPDIALQAQITKLEFNDYTYSDIVFNGRYAANRCSGTLISSDSNAQISAHATICGIGTAPQTKIDIRIPNLDLAELHLSDAALNQRVAFNMSAEAHTSTGENVLDATIGCTHIDSMVIEGAGNRLFVPYVDADLHLEKGQRHLQIESPLLTASIDGDFQWSTLASTILRMVHHCMPSLVADPGPLKKSNDLNFEFELLQPNELFAVLSANPPVFESTPIFHGFVHDSDTTFSLQISPRDVIKRNQAFQNASMVFDNINPNRDIIVSFNIRQHILQEDSTGLRIDDVLADLRLCMHNDSILTSMQFGTLANWDSLPDILVETTFAREMDKLAVHAHILPTAFSIGDVDWHVMESNIYYSGAKQTLDIDSLMLFTRHQMMMVDGRMSTSQNDSLRVQLEDIDLGYLLSATKVVDAIDFRGKVTGWVTLYGAFAVPQFEANLEVPQATINGTSLGCVRAEAHFDHEQERVILAGRAVRDSVCIADIKGFVIPINPATWDLQIDANGLPLTFVSYWTQGIVEQIDGNAYGHVHVYGYSRRTFVTTRAYAQDASLVVPATGARYYFSDSIVMDTAYIDFPGIHLHDAQGHSGFMSGRLNHHDFKDFNFKLNAECNELLAIDMSASSGSAYYGKAYATGKVSITGDDTYTAIDVNASTAPNTEFFLSLATASSASSSEFITFKKSGSNPNLTPADEDTVIAKPKSHLYLDLNIDVQPTARVHLVLNDQTGDGIVGRGQGTVRLGMDATTGEMQLLGAYRLQSGTFSYTVGNLVHRDFAIADGSTVSFTGNPSNPTLDITAKYRCTASLRDLFGNEASQITNRPSIPVDCIIRIGGSMNKMSLKFGIEYPQSDESVSAQINAVINTEAMLMRQVIYLLVFNRFYTPDYLRDASSNLNDAYSLVSSTVTGQINSWLSKLTSMVNVGFNLRKDGSINENAFETEANIQIQPIERLTINGNLGYRTQSLTNQPIFGDADVEYELTADGQFRAKVFTHSVDQYSLHQSGMQEGIGFLFRHDFNPGDAKRHREMKKKRDPK